MAKVGRPSSRTNQGNVAPTRELGVPDLGLGGWGITGANSLLTGGSGPWRMFVDEWEYVPELRWPWSVRLYDQMRTDSQLAGLLTAVMWGISQLRFVLDPNGCPDDMVKEVSQDLNVPILGEDDAPRGRMKGRFSHSKHITQAMLAAIYGHMYFNIVGEIVDGKWRLRKLAPRMPQTIRQINVADDGGLVSLVQWTPVNWTPNTPANLFGPEIPVDNLIAYVFQQEGSNWAGRSMMRDTYKDWLLKDRNLRVEAINHERAGGVPYANAPMGATVDEVEALDQMMRNFRIGESAGGALPYGAELKIAKGTGSDVDKTIKRLDEAMARRFLLQLANLAQGGQHVGSYALSETFEDFFLVGQRQIAEWYCETTTEHLIEDIIDWNYGEDTELTPRLTWERSSEDSLGTEQLATLVERGVITMDQEMEDWVRYRYLMPKKKEPRPEVTLGGPRQPFEQKGEGSPAQSGTEPGQVVPPKATTPSTAAGLGDPVLPPSSGPAVTASFVRRWFTRKPDVSASAGPKFVTVPNVPILEVGVEYNLSTGPYTCTAEDLVDAVRAANEDRSIPNPRLAIGHIDPRWNDEEYMKNFDGEPNWGTAANLRLSDNGMVAYADYTGVPAWLAEILPYAFPSRSIEGFHDLESNMGNHYRFVLSRCSLLGIQWPGITQLEDLPMYYGEEVPADVVVAPELLAAATSGNQPGGDPVKNPFKRGVAASANLDDVRRAFYGKYRPAMGVDTLWVRAVLVDPNEIVIEDDETGKLYRLPFKSTGQGDVEFGDAAVVSFDLVPEDQPDLMRAAASHVAATLELGRTVLASWPTRAASSPDNTGGAMDPKEVRKHLNLPEDASDEQVHLALLAKAGISAEQPPATPAPGEQPAAPATPATPAPATPAPGEEQTPGAPATPGTPDPQQPAQPAQIAAGLALPDGIVAVDKGTYDALVGSATRASAFIDRQEERDREGLVMAAIGDGRIPPASKDHWLNLLKADPQAGATLASLSPGLVPVSERGHGHSPDAQGAVELEDQAISDWSASLFPEVRRLRQQEAVAASGGATSRPRIQTDAHYSRR